MTFSILPNNMKEIMGSELIMSALMWPESTLLLVTD